MIYIRSNLLNWKIENKIITKQLEFLEDCLLAIDDSGHIEWSGLFSNMPDHIRLGYDKSENSKYNWPDKILFPGFIDLHLHLPQFGAWARDGLDLLPWLSKTIFPFEKSYHDPNHSLKQTEMFYHALAKAGTTTSFVYGPTWLEAMNQSFIAAKASGLRTFLGPTLMDDGSYRQSNDLTNESMAELATLYKDHHVDDGLVQLSVIPRFALSCSWDLLEFCGDFAQKNGLFIQTHMSENQKEITDTLAKFPDFKFYAEIYDKANLINKKTILAHCIHLFDEEIEIIKNRKAAVAYCPSSNLFLYSGIFNLSLQDKVSIALGSDIAGGHDLSMLETCKISLFAQKAKTVEFNKYAGNLKTVSEELKKEIAAANQHSATEALFLATAANSNFLGAAYGHLNRGAHADFVCYDMEDIFIGNADPKNTLSANEMASLIVYKGSSLPVKSTWVAGNCVYEKT